MNKNKKSHKYSFESPYDLKNEVDEDKLYLPVSIKLNCISIERVVSEDKKYSENFKCPICTDLIYYPSTCSNCSCLFGKSCLENWTSQGSDTCPFGCKNLKIKSKNDHILMDILSKINLVCENDKCKETPAHENYYHHLQNCKYRKYYCLGHNCKFQGTESQIIEHTKYNCEKLEKPCKNCGKRFNLKRLTNHIKFCGISSNKNDLSLVLSNSQEPNLQINYQPNIVSNKNILTHQFNFSISNQIADQNIGNRNQSLLKCLKKVSLFILYTIFICFFLKMFSFRKIGIVIDNFFSNLFDTKKLIRDEEGISFILQKDVYYKNKIHHLIDEYNEKALFINASYQEANASLDEILNLISKYTEIIEDKNLGSKGYKTAFKMLKKLLKGLNLYDDSYKKYVEIMSNNDKYRSNYRTAMNIIGVAMIQLGRVDESIPCFHKAIEFDSNFKEAHWNLGNALVSLEEHDKALTNFKRVIELDPNDIQAHNALGNSLIESKRYLEAIDIYQIIVKLQPMNEKAYNNLGHAYYKLGKFSEALINFDKAININPIHKEAYNNKGSCLYELGQYSEAVKSYHKVLEIDPMHKEAYYNLEFILDNFRKEVDEDLSYINTKSN